MNLRDKFNDLLLSLLCGIALLIVTRGAYQLGAGWLPDAWLLTTHNPLATLAAARLLLFGLLAVLVALPLARLLASQARQRALPTALPGASCAAVLFLLLEWSGADHPFPRWFDLARAAWLFLLPLLFTAWWWRRSRH